MGAETFANIFTVDVEDWFHILDLQAAPNIKDWPTLESRIERNFYDLLEVMDRFGVRSTCFFLGWVAERFPHLVQRAHLAGHEIASHGYGHQLIHRMSSNEFRDDVRRSKDILESITGERILGYRAPGFSITPKTIWALEIVEELGFKYDSSIFPARHGHGGFWLDNVQPQKLKISNTEIFEFPISVSQLGSRRIYFLGGGYFRLFPYRLIRRAILRMNQKEGRPAICYVHPRKLDPGQPRLKMPFSRRFRTYVNLRGAKKKMERLFRDFEFTSCEKWLRLHAPDVLSDRLHSFDNRMTTLSQGEAR